MTTRTWKLALLALGLGFFGAALSVSQVQFLFKAWLHAGF